MNVWTNSGTAEKEFSGYHHLEDLSMEVWIIYKTIEATEAVLAPKTYLTCNDCGYKIRDISISANTIFNRHIKEHEMDREDCGCEIEFESSKAKRLHIQLEHSHLERVKCDFCDNIGTKNSVARHMEYAHEVKNIVCEDCGKTCKKEADLGQHYLTKHKVYRCEECNVTFVGTAKLRRHLAFVHGKKHPKHPEFLANVRNVTSFVLTKVN